MRGRAKVAVAQKCTRKGHTGGCVKSNQWVGREASLLLKLSEGLKKSNVRSTWKWKTDVAGPCAGQATKT